MKKYKFTGTLTISAFTEVEAETPEEALRIAEERDNMMIVHDGNNNKNECWMVDDLDGEIYSVEGELYE